ncbi:MAG: MFS transporter [Candidatus Methanomethylophilaceae archaeon]|nr:MFS transporter [Candidatus Methanomethylophilaceae archaeon]
MGDPRVRSEKLLLLAVAVAVLMDGMDGSVVYVALPSIATSLGTDTASASWVTVVYFMMLAGLILFFGRIADRGAIRKVFVSGFAIFTLASLFCGISDSLGMLLVSRVVQGIGGAMMAAASPMICVKYVSRSKLGLALSVTTLGSALGYTIGPAMGGIVTDLLSWHWIFLINIPIGIAAIAIAMYAMPKDGPTEKRSLDFPGTALLFGSIAAAIYGLEISADPTAGLHFAASMAACLILLALFALREFKFHLPLIDVRIFKAGAFNLMILAFLLYNLAYMGLFYLIPFYMDLSLGFSPSQTGLYLLIPSAITAVICLPLGRLSDRKGRRWFAVWASLCLLGFNVLLWLMNMDFGLWMLVPVVVLMGVSWGLAGGPMAGRVVEHAPRGNEGMASSVMSMFIYLGCGLGTALFAAFFSIMSGAPGTSFSMLSIPEFTSGYSAALLLAIAISAVAVLLSFVVKDSDIRYSDVDPSEVSDAEKVDRDPSLRT